MPCQTEAIAYKIVKVGKIASISDKANTTISYNQFLGKCFITLYMLLNFQHLSK